MAVEISKKHLLTTKCTHCYTELTYLKTDVIKEMFHISRSSCGMQKVDPQIKCPACKSYTQV